MRSSILSLTLIILLPLLAYTQPNIISYEAEGSKIRMYWKDDAGKILGSIGNLVKWQESKRKKVAMAMNGGMYMEDQRPLGLYVENGKDVRPIITATSGYGNFYMQPNGVFYLTRSDNAGICTTQDYYMVKSPKYATQSGPMLVTDGQINNNFKKGSTNVYIRNGVGISDKGKVIFAISKDEINLYDFAEWFLQQGCNNALFLDGFVSRMYLPSKNYIQKDGAFGVMIAVTE